MTRAFDKIKKGIDEALAIAKGEAEYEVYINKMSDGGYLIVSDKEPIFAIEEKTLNAALKKACDAFNYYNEFSKKKKPTVTVEDLTKYYNSGKLKWGMK